MIKSHHIVGIVLAILFVGLVAGYNTNSKSEAIKLTDVKALTFKSGHYTNARRSSAIPQLECIGGTASSRHDLRPTIVQCVNQGTDGVDVQWSCSAELDSRVKLGDIDVSCEGYTHPDDPLVLKGSCGLRYSLEYTVEGQRSTSSSWGSSHSQTTGVGGGLGTVVTFIIVAIVLVGAMSVCCGSSTSSGYSAAPVSGMGYNGGGVNGMGYSAPPPSAYPSYSAPSNGGSYWSGFTTGGMLGYLFAPRATTYYNPAAPSWGSGSSWGSSSSSSSYSSSSPSRSRTSTSYGGTSRR